MPDYLAALETLPLKEGWKRYVAIGPAEHWRSIRENGFCFRHRAIEGAAIDFDSNQKISDYLVKASDPAFHPRLSFRGDNIAILLDLPEDIAMYFENPATPKPRVKIPGTPAEWNQVDAMFLKGMIKPDGNIEILPEADTKTIDAYRKQLFSGHEQHSTVHQDAGMRK